MINLLLVVGMFIGLGSVEDQLGNFQPVGCALFLVSTILLAYRSEKRGLTAK